MKKVIVMILIFSLVLTFAACGNDDQQEEQVPEGETQENVDDGESEDDTPPADTVEDFYTEGEYDFGMKLLDTEGDLDGIFEKRSYEDLKGVGDEFRKMISDNLAASDMGSFLPNEDEEEADEVFVSFSEEGAEKKKGAYIQSGIMQDIESGKYFQFADYSSSAVMKASDIDVDKLAEWLEKTFCISIDKKKTEKGLEQALESAKDQKKIVLLTQTGIADSEDIREMVQFTADAYDIEGEYYVRAEVTRRRYCEDQ